MEKSAEPAIGALIDRIGTEPDGEICEEIARALGAIGPPAVGPLVEIIQQDDLRQLPVATAALMLMGKEAAAEIAKLLEVRDDNVRKTALAVLRELGGKAASAMPAAAEMLDQDNDDETVGYALAGIWACGPHGLAAAPAVIRCFLERDGELANLCHHALYSMGPDVRPMIEAALLAASGEERQRLERVLAGLPGLEEARFALFERLGRDDLLEMFVHVGRILERQGPTSWTAISGILTEQEKKGEIEKGRFPLAIRSLGMKMKQLEGLLGVKLTGHGGTQKGGLTSDGIALLPKADAYLAAKRRRMAADD